MNKAKSSASLMVIIIVVGMLSFFSFIPKPIQQLERSYITSDATSIKQFIVWQKPNVTVVNASLSFYINFYRWTLNQTSGKVSSALVDSWLINFTTKEVYENQSATSAIQWALDNGQSQDIVISSGNYTITNTINISKSNIHLLGYGSIFNIPSNFTGNSVVCIDGNFTNVSIQGLHIDATKWNWSNYLVGEVNINRKQRDR